MACLCCRGVSPAIVIGHSMGGKVALEYLKQCAEGRSTLVAPKHVWVLDSQPGEVPEGTMSDVDQVLQAVKVCPTQEALLKQEQSSSQVHRVHDASAALHASQPGYAHCGPAMQ